MVAAKYALHMDSNRQIGKQTKQRYRQTAMNNESTKRKEDSLAYARQTGIYTMCIYMSILHSVTSSGLRLECKNMCEIAVADMQLECDMIVVSHTGLM